MTIEEQELMQKLLLTIQRAIEQESINKRTRCLLLKTQQAIEQELIEQELLKKSERIDELKKAAESGDAEANFNIGQMYDRGIGVSKKDEKEAFKWFLKAAELGYAKAQHKVALCFYYGRIGMPPQNFVETFKWFRKAAEQGLSDSQCCLGIMYLEGKGVSKDEKEAFKWFLKSAELGCADGMIKVGKMYAGGIGVSKDEKEALKWCDEGFFLKRFDITVPRL
ncbi:MAG: sel1 repeat family protein [Elusimicrobiota bacterium]|jgi:TPR repeat protein|nr:sel1 repeat family protein [Elusimicrobiota bacterium]